MTSAILFQTTAVYPLLWEQSCKTGQKLLFKSWIITQLIGMDYEWNYKASHYYELYKGLMTLTLRGEFGKAFSSKQLFSFFFCAPWWFAQTTKFGSQLITRPQRAFLNCFFFLSSKTRHRRKPHQLLLPHASTTRFLNSFFYHSALLWSSLRRSIQTITSKPAFRIAVKDHWPTFKCRTDYYYYNIYILQGLPCSRLLLIRGSPSSTKAF